MKNRGFRVDVLKVDANRLDSKFRTTQQARFITNQQGDSKISRAKKAAEIDMANPMNTDQFRVAAKAAVDESEFHSLFLDIYLSFFPCLLCLSLKATSEINKSIRNYQQSPTTMTISLIIELLLMLSPAI